MGNPEDKESDSGTTETGAESMPCSLRSQPGEGSQGCCLSQTSSGGHSKGDGQGSCALPGITK